jgi:hypothetical protein
MLQEVRSWHFINVDERIKAARSIACSRTDTVQQIAGLGCDAVRTGTAVPLKRRCLPMKLHGVTNFLLIAVS